MSPIKKSLFFSFAAILCAFSLNAYSLPFNIIPNGALPTTVPAGGTTTASYKVTNNTTAQRTGNFVKYLPPNVTQVTGGTGVCGTTFTLGALGSG